MIYLGKRSWAEEGDEWYDMIYLPYFGAVFLQLTDIRLSTYI
jgi:hypothetical protein